MGRIAAPFGVKGWVKVQPFTAAAKNLLGYPRWWVQRGDEWQEYEVAEARAQLEMVVARLAGCEDRDAAAGIQGSGDRGAARRNCRKRNRKSITGST